MLIYEYFTYVTHMPLISYTVYLLDSMYSMSHMRKGHVSGIDNIWFHEFCV